MGWRLALLWLVGVVLLSGLMPAKADSQGPSEAQLKAAFLMSFPKYVEWPAAAFAQTNSPVVLGVLGDDNTAGALEEMIASTHKTVNGHPIMVKRIGSDDDLTNTCHLLFVGPSERARFGAIVAKVKDAHVLTVSQSEDFLAQGGMINLVPKDRRLHLEVNLTASSQAHLKIGSALLSVADVVKGKAN